jgi:membrane-bound lytic murein transglycosylase A
MECDRASAQALGRGVVAGLVGAIIFFTAHAASAEGPLKFAGSQLEPVRWTDLAGWSADDHLAAFAAYQAGCQAARKMRRTDDHGQIFEALWNICRNAVSLQPRDAATARAFFEQNFRPVRISRLGEAEGLVTGYFEPVVAGSRFPSPEFHVPLYRRPPDLVAAGYKSGSLAFPNKGVRVGRRNGSEIVPYHDRGAIEAGALDGQKLEICWLKDPLDLLAIQMEGSARVILEDGTPLRISYDSHNGYRYSSFERVLIERNLISRQEMSAQRIRDWMTAHPEEAANVRATNRSYVFFRVTGLTNEGEPVGAQGVPLTPGRSIAVDRVHEYGTPFFIEANLPIENAKSASPFGRLMIAQDTGSAIVGPARADLYLGAGDEAGRIANRIRHSGRFVMLLPRELDLVVAGTQMPLPVPKPKIAEDKEKETEGKSGAGSTKAGEIVAGKPAAPPTAKAIMAATDVRKIDVKKPDGKGTANAAKAGETGTGKHAAPVAAKPTLAATDARKIDAKKPDGKGTANSAKAGETVAGKRIPPPTPAKPTLVATEARKIDAKKPDGKGTANSAKAGETVAGKRTPPPTPAKPTLVATEGRKIDAKKLDGKGTTNSAKAGETVAGKRAAPPLAAKPKTPAVEAKKPEAKGKTGAANSDEDAARSGRQAGPTRKSTPL